MLLLLLLKEVPKKRKAVPGYVLNEFLSGFVWTDRNLLII